MKTRSQREASARNGRLGGRPLKKSEHRKKLQYKARMWGECALPEAVDFAIKCVRGLVPGVDHATRLRASEAIMDRFGAPRLNQQQLVGEFPMKVVDLTVPEEKPKAAEPEPETETNGSDPDQPTQH